MWAQLVVMVQFLRLRPPNSQTWELSAANGIFSFVLFLKLLARRQQGLKMGLEQEEQSPLGLAMVEREMDVPIPLIFLINFHYGEIKVGSVGSPPGLVLALFGGGCAHLGASFSRP